MKNLANYLGLALSLMFQLEQQIPQSGMGATKKEVILNTIKLAAQTAEGASAINPLVGLVGAFVDVTVSIFNKTGVFKKSETPVAAAAPVVDKVA